MINHLVSKHEKEAEKLKSCKNKIEKKKNAKTDTGQLPSGQQKLSFTSKKLTNTRQKLITNAICEMIYSDLRPLNFICGKGFVHLMYQLEPLFTIPSRQTFREKILPGEYDEIKKAIQNDLKEVEFLGISYDGWQSINIEPFISLMCHYIDNYYVWKHLILKTFKVKQDETGKYISTKINKKLIDYGINSARTYIISISDCGSNMIKAAKLLGTPHFGCFAHCLHNTLKSLLDIKEIEYLSNKAKKIVKYFKTSGKRYMNFKQLQEKLKLVVKALKMDAETRWNSLYLMLSRLIELRVPLQHFGIEEKKQKLANIIFDHKE